VRSKAALVTDATDSQRTRRLQIESEAQTGSNAAVDLDSAVSGVNRHPAMQPGRVIAGKFKLIRELGQGGMGAVWAAVHEALGREVAVKFLHPQSDHSALLTERFVSEARMVASIKHRFVVDVFDFGVTEDGLYYMVLELLQGPSLAQRMDHGPAFPVRAAVQLMADCLRGLQVVHEAGIVHRDLKPDNIFVIEDADGTFPKLIDFGISKRTQTDSPFAKLSGKAGRITKPGTVIGTPFYMPPEQLRGRGDVDARADIYSVGVILFELLAGHLPFNEDNIGDLMVAITVRGAPELAKLRPELGEGISRILARALSAQPERRYASALQLREALLAVLPSLPEHAESVVQTHDGSRGQITGTQLQAGKRPFRAAHLTRQFRVGRIPVLWLLGLALLLVGMIAVWWPNNSEPQSKLAALPLPVSSAERLVPAPKLPAAISEPAANRPEPAAVSSTTPESAQPVPAAKRAAPRAARPAAAAAHTRAAASTKPAAQPAPAQKLFRKLDF
jgi:eukaryotic-like serine/threonine-protein kinase